MHSIPPPPTHTHSQRDDEPRDFYRKFDRKSGKIYYVNFATKKTSWKLPPRAVVKEIKDLKAAEAERKRRDQQEQRRQEEEVWNWSSF